jgi:glycerol-3-phosphate dehydrogenase
VHLEDVMVRRTGWHYYYSEADRMAEQVAEWMALLFSWPEETRRMELDHYRQLNCHWSRG